MYLIYLCRFHTIHQTHSGLHIIGVLYMLLLPAPPLYPLSQARFVPSVILLNVETRDKVTGVRVANWPRLALQTSEQRGYIEVEPGKRQCQEKQKEVSCRA